MMMHRIGNVTLPFLSRSFVSRALCCRFIYCFLAFAFLGLWQMFLSLYAWLP